jgi:tRNA dimethylallyltransferase
MAGLIVIAGPTASGKSAFALRLAEALGGVVINADSMQLYRELRLLTARPDPADAARVPHRLYGILPADRPASAGLWLELAEDAIGEAVTRGWLPIVVGGTGLYLRALLQGLAPVPAIPEPVRHATRALFERLGAAAFHAELARRDPASGTRLGVNDRQRLMRAWEVLEATGRPLGVWQRLPARRLRLPEPTLGFVVLPPRANLYRRIGERLQAMLAAGALAELEALAAHYPAADLPLLKALGVAALSAHLDGRLSLEQALARATLESRRYAKRQLTFFRHQLPELRPLDGFGDDAAAMPAPGTLERLLLTGEALPHSFRPTP